MATGEQKKGGIVLDDWKLPIYRKRLEKAGYKYEDAGEFSPGTTVLTVYTKDVAALEKVLRRAEAQCQRKISK